MTVDDREFDDALATLQGGLTGTEWPSAHELRGTATRRRRRRRLAGVTAAGLAVATAITLVVVTPGDPSRPDRHIAAGLRQADQVGDAVQLVANVAPLSAAPDAAAEKAVADAEQAFTFALLHQTNRAGGTDNVVLSPSSLAIALAMLQNGAVGETRSEIAKVLRTSGLTNAQQNAGWSALMADLANAGKADMVTLQSANSLWLQDGLPMEQSFMAAMAQYFKSGVWQVDFMRDPTGANKAINAWVKDQTHGKITRLFKDGDLTSDTVAVLANAVYFKANWQSQFNPKLTTDGAFTLPGGSTATVPFMATSPSGMVLPATAAGGYDAVQLPYTGGRYAALAIMPKDRDLTSFVDGLSPTALRRITSALKNKNVDLRLPRFTTSQYTKLNDTMYGMGMVTAFSPSADYSAMSPVAPKLQTVAQRDYLHVDETGSEAAAVTGISVDLSSAGRPSAKISFDHPFLFLIRDTTTGTILFAAQVQHPAG